MDLLQSLPPDKWTAERLWAELDADTRRLAARALYERGWDDEASRAEADQAIAAALRARPLAVRRLPVGKRADYLVRVVRPDHSLATALLMACHCSGVGSQPVGL